MREMCVRAHDVQDMCVRVLASGSPARGALDFLPCRPGPRLLALVAAAAAAAEAGDPRCAAEEASRIPRIVHQLWLSPEEPARDYSQLLARILLIEMSRIGTG